MPQPRARVESLKTHLSPFLRSLSNYFILILAFKGDNYVIVFVFFIWPLLVLTAFLLAFTYLLVILTGKSCFPHVLSYI